MYQLGLTLWSIVRSVVAKATTFFNVIIKFSSLLGDYNFLNIDLCLSLFIQKVYS